jgi:predicted RNA-binding protein YlqC (UPF0109 family)
MLCTLAMPKRISKLANSPRQPGEIQVKEWDFMALLHTDIRELEVTRSLRRLGGIQVMEWDFRTVLPAVKRIANQEVDLIDLVKRTAQYKVMDWDFRTALLAKRKPVPRVPARPLAKSLSRAEMQAITVRLKDFLQYMIANLIVEPDHAQIKATKIGSNGLRFTVVLGKRDMAMLIGREGFTASAIRSILKAAAGMNGVQALLQIQSRDEEMTLGTKDEAPQ